MAHPLKLGRKPRIFNPAVPHMSALMSSRDRRHIGPPPATADYLSKLPNDVGMMLNDQLGDCTCAGIYHALQVWTGNVAQMQTNADVCVQRTYEMFCGYDPNNPGSDQGGIEQDVLKDWQVQGVPLTVGGTSNKLAAWLEVDPRNIDDVKRTINDCGLCYIGFDVPENILPADGSPPPNVWSIDPNAQIIGGHCVVLGAYDDAGAGLISWGNPRFKMTWDFFRQYTSEAYALVDEDWVDATGKTPLGMSLTDLTALMAALKRQP